MIDSKMTSRLSSKGQITVPKPLRERLALEPGDLVAYEIEGDRLILRRMEPFDAAFHTALTSTLEDEWMSPEDEDAFGEL